MKVISVLFSPGLDSFLAKHYIKSSYDEKNYKIRYVYADINSKYSQYEIELLRKWYGKEIEIIPGPDMYLLERIDSYIPNRNAILACLVQAYTNSDIVLLNATFDDRVSDGSIEFRKHLSGVLSESASKEVIVDSILKDYEKSECVKRFVKENPDKRLDLINKTYSCYSQDCYECEDIKYYELKEDGYAEAGKTSIYGCMECVACWRRACALTSANLYIPFYNFDIVKEFTDKKKVDESVYPNRYKSINSYYKFMEWISSEG